METKTDILNEQRFSDKLQFLWGVELVKLPQLYRADFAIMQDGRVTGFIEFKQRAIESTKYNTALLSLEKWMYLHVLSDTTGIPVYLAIGYSDCDTFIQVSDRVSVEVSIRDNRPVVLIPVHSFERL